MSTSTIEIGKRGTVTRVATAWRKPTGKPVKKLPMKKCGTVEPGEIRRVPAGPISPGITTDAKKDETIIDASKVIVIIDGKRHRLSDVLQTCPHFWEVVVGWQGGARLSGKRKKVTS